MERWFLDNGPLGLLARHIQAPEMQPDFRLHVMEAVARGSEFDRSGREQKWLSSGCFETHIISVGTSAFQFLERLRPDSTVSLVDLGEHESIAYCAVEDRVSIFVTLDKGAAFLALAELGRGRVATPFDLWADMLARGFLSKVEAEQLNTATAKKNGVLAGIPARFVL